MYNILGALANLRKTTELRHVCLSVCPSFRMEQLVSHWNGFSLYFILVYFLKICRENPNFINAYKKRVFHMNTNIHFYNISLISY